MFLGACMNNGFQRFVGHRTGDEPMKFGSFAKKVKALACLIRSFTLAVAIVPASLAGTSLAIDLNLRGLGGSWHTPAIAGQGIHLEIHPDAIAPGRGRLQGSWATFSEYVEPWDDAGPRWFTFAGVTRAGQPGGTFTIYENVGGNFNAPPATSGREVGSVELSVVDCTTIDMMYTLDRFSPPGGTIRLVRLMPDVTCVASASGVGYWDDLPVRLDPAMPGQRFVGDWEHSGNWFNPATPGQGFAFEVNPSAAVVFFVWYAYGRDGDSRQRWYTGQASYIPGSRTLPVTLFETRMSWGPDGKIAHSTAVGTATATFHDCDAASLTFSFTAGSNLGASGTIGLIRLGRSPMDCNRLPSEDGADPLR
jgi:hypothetical protein